MPETEIAHRLLETRSAVIEDPSGTKISLELYSPREATGFKLYLGGQRVGADNNRRINVGVYTAYVFLEYMISDLNEILGSEPFQNAIESRVDFHSEIEIWNSIYIGHEAGSFYIGCENTIGIRKVRLDDPVQTLNELKEILETIVENPDRT